MIILKFLVSAIANDIRIFADVVVYIFPHLITYDFAQKIHQDTNWQQTFKELVKLGNW